MSVGNLIETFPITISAFSLANFNAQKICLKYRTCCLLFSFIVLHLIMNYNIFSNINGFSSPGIKQIIISLFLFIFSSLIPLEIFNEKILYIIKQITKYTQGIYCLHFLFQYYMKLKLDKEGTFIGCIILYIISYFTSLIGFKIFKKTKIKFLFA